MKKLDRILTYVLLGFFIVYDAAALKGSNVLAEKPLLCIALSGCIGFGLFFVAEILSCIVHRKKGE